MPNPKLKLMPNPRPMPPLMPTMATTATPHTTVDTTVVDTIVDTLAVITVMVDTTPTLTDTATDISARGPLMPNPRPMPPPMPGMATTDTVDTPTVMVDTTVVDTTGVKLVNSTPNHFFHPKPSLLSFRKRRKIKIITIIPFYHHQKVSFFFKLDVMPKAMGSVQKPIQSYAKSISVPTTVVMLN